MQTNMSKYRRKKTKRTWKSEKKEWHSNDEGHEEAKRRTTKKIQIKTKSKAKKQKQTNKCRKPVHPIKEMKEQLK